MPPNHQTRIFKNGFFSLSQVTGHEHADICRILLGTIIDLPLQKNHSDAATSAILQTVQALLDFAYLAQYPVHSNQTLDEMNDVLERFHNNKDIFVELRIRADFDINKLHYTIHYRLMIERFGSTDNYNTEHTERLHIPFAKDAFEATNFKNEYPQMAIFVERK